MIALVALAMVADLLTFALAVPRVGIGAELNPVMRQAYVEAGLIAVVALKAACTVALVLLVLRVEPSRRGLCAGIGIAIGLLGAVANVTA